MGLKGKNAPLRPKMTEITTNILHRRFGLLGIHASSLGLGDIRLEVLDANALLEELIKLLVRAAGGLDLVEPEVDQANYTECTVNECGLCSKVGLIRVEEVWDHECPDSVDLFSVVSKEASFAWMNVRGTHDVLETNTDGDGLGTKPRGGNLGQQCVGCGTDCDIVKEVVDEDHRDGALDSTRASLDSETCTKHEDHSHNKGAPDSQGSSTELIDEEPGDNVASHTAAVLANLELERVRSAVASKLDVVSSVCSDEVDASKRLDRQWHDRDNGASQVRLLKTLKVRSACGFHLRLLEGNLHLRDLLGDLEVGKAEAAQ